MSITLFENRSTMFVIVMLWAKVIYVSGAITCFSCGPGEGQDTLEVSISLRSDTKIVCEETLILIVMGFWMYIACVRGVYCVNTL